MQRQASNLAGLQHRCLPALELLAGLRHLVDVQCELRIRRRADALSHVQGIEWPISDARQVRLWTGHLDTDLPWLTAILQHAGVPNLCVDHRIVGSLFAQLRGRRSDSQRAVCGSIHKYCRRELVLHASAACWRAKLQYANLRDAELGRWSMDPVQ